ncbi:MAG TPA: mitofilin family membrane protein, partial [Patescibacteria group bacterium]|nr:mitofilin family membrane protein [Patescibacteria group bacterium]
KTDQTAEDLTRLNGAIDGLRRAMPPEGTILRLAERAEQAEKAVRDVAAQQQSAQALLLVVGQLREAIDRGDPYDIELRAARRIAPAEEAPSLDALTASASTGVARRDALVADFPALASAIVRAEFAPDGNFWQRALNKLTALVNIRRIDGTGADTAAIVARAEARVKDGDLAKAVQELSALQGAPAQVAAPWLKSAGARVAADRTLSQLAATAAAQTVAKGG